MMPGLIDDPGIFARTRRIGGGQLFARQHFGKADDRVERRTQFMAHIGQKTILPDVRAFSAAIGFRQNRLMLKARGDVADDSNHFASRALNATHANFCLTKDRRAIALRANAQTHKRASARLA